MLISVGDLSPEMAKAFGQASRIAWDVETTGLDWQRDRLGTCQLYAEGVGVAIVSVDTRVPRRLVELLEKPGVEKVFHHAPFDLRFMVNAWRVWPAAIRCTKVASKLLDPEAPNEAHSLQRLVGRYLGVTLEKGTVRTSDWSSVNLSPEQVDYAAGDVLYLLLLLDALQGTLEVKGLTRLYNDCCAFLSARAVLEVGGYPDVFTY